MSEDCPVVGIDTKSTPFGTRAVQRVRTSQGDIETSCVVNCTGVWANYISDMVRQRDFETLISFSVSLSEGEQKYV